MMLHANHTKIACSKVLPDAAILRLLTAANGTTLIFSPVQQLGELFCGRPGVAASQPATLERLVQWL